MIINTGLDKLTQIFPKYIAKSLKKNKNQRKLIEVIIDLGRRPEGRFLFGSEYLSEQIVSWQDIEYTTKRLGKFTSDNRAGIERSLHRVSCLRNKQGNIVGLSCRIGRCVLGSVGIIKDLLDSEESLLILGKPGLGKTTYIREISRILSDEIQKRVVIVDTANEIAGDGDITHVGIGRARRMQLAPFKNQYDLMIEAIENHMPEVIVVDEIGTELEALAARTIAERGVKLIGTAHANSLENLIKNPILSDLIGGIHYVTLSDEEARKRKTQKTILERKSLPAFYLAVELSNKNKWTIHENVETSVDTLLKHQALRAQSRSLIHKRLVRIQYTDIKEKTNFSVQLPSNFEAILQKTPKKKLKTFNLLENKEKEAKFLFSKKEKIVLNKKKKQKKDQKQVFLKLNKQSNQKIYTKVIQVYLGGFSMKEKKKLSISLKKPVKITNLLSQSNVLIVSKLYLQQRPRVRNFLKKRKLSVYLLKKDPHKRFKSILNAVNKLYVS